jgi:NAD(P)-dependent dehydrogenase (short-subunit alcohol dehydrogenase family)
MTGIEGKVALVTGAASGIGRASAAALAKEGAQVVVADVDEKGAEETCRIIAAAGGRARFASLDVTSEDAWGGVIAEVERREAALHFLINDAGICISAPLLEMSFAAFKRQNAVNIDGVFLGTKAALPLIVRSGGGSVVNLSSVAGQKGVIGLSGYCASKGAVRLFTKAVALECARARNGVRVNSIHPGAIETPIWVKMGAGGDLPELGANELADRMEETRARADRTTPIGSAGKPEDIAAGVVYLCSAEARFVTGSELVIDGGALAA